MSDAESDGDIFHSNGESHSRRGSCHICREERESERRSRMTEVERLAEDMIEEVLKAIRKGDLNSYIQAIAIRLHEAEKLSAATEEDLQGSYRNGVEYAKEQMRILMDEKI